MAIPFESPIDLKSYAVQRLTLGTAGDAAGGLGYTSSDAVSIGGALTGVDTGYPYWVDNDLVYHPILPYYDYENDPSGSGTARVVDGAIYAPVFFGDLTGTAVAATQWLTATTIALTNKATAAAVTVNTGGVLALDVTALSVSAGEIVLADGSFLVGNGSGVAEQKTKTSIPISGFGAAVVPVAMGGQQITGLGYPSSDTDAASKAYVDDVFSGVSPSAPARVATAAALSAYTPAGSPATLTANANGALTVDGVALSNGDRVLLKDESGANEKYNGIYGVTDAGSAGTPWVLDRAEDADTTVEVNTGDEYFVVDGTANGGTSWALATPAPITLGTTALYFVQTGGGAQYSAGSGLVQVGNVFHFAQSTNYTQFGVPYATGVSTIGFTGAGSANQVFRIPGAGGAPAFGALDLDASGATTGTLGVERGGTNIGSYTVGDLLYASGVGTLSTLSAEVWGNVLLSGGNDTAPEWGKVNLEDHVDGILRVTTGGTGQLTLANRGVLYGKGSSPIGSTAAPSTGQLLVGDGTGTGSLPKFATVSGDLTATYTGTNEVFTIGAGAVSLAKMADVGSGVVLGRRAGAGIGVVQQVTLADLADDLMATGNIDPATTLTGDVTGAGVGAVVTTIANLPFTKLQNGSALSVLGVAGASPGSVASIVSGGANRVLRTNAGGTAVEFGSINLASSNAVTGILGTVNGGTGTSTNLTFPGTPGAVPIIKTVELTPGSSQYTVAHGMSTSMLLTAVRNSSGAMVFVQVDIDVTNVVVTFGAPTVAGHTLIIVGSDVL